MEVRYSGSIIATDVGYEEFLHRYEGQRVEWIDGSVIEISPVSSDHNTISVFAITLFQAYLERTGGGRVFHDPMVMRPGDDFPGRSPDIQVILPHKYPIIGQNEIAGAADLVVEIVSPDSHRRDRVEKFNEYERAGVPEYWILDPIQRETLFYQLAPEGIYQHIPVDPDGYYQSRVLDRLRIKADLFWHPPGFWVIGEMIEDMLR